MAEKKNGGILNLIEVAGNRLPDPATLFFLGMVLVMVLSHFADSGDWSVSQMLPQPATETVMVDGESVTRPVLDEDGDPSMAWKETGTTFTATSLLTRDGLYWLVSNLVDNFTGFAPLGVVLVGMLGIGIAERTGMMAALLKGFMLIVPKSLLTPAMVFIGIMSSMTLDAGYVVLPPLAALLYKAVGRSPLAGLAAVFAGVAAGFNANLFVTSLDPMLAELSTTGAAVLDSTYAVAATSNLWFMIASTFVITLAGWFVTAQFVEKRLNNKSPEEGGPAPATAGDLDSQRLKPEEKKAMAISGLVFFALAGLMLVCVLVKGAPLYTYSYDVTSPDGVVTNVLAEVAPFVEGQEVPAGSIVKDGLVMTQKSPPFPRWVDAIVPLLFVLFIIPGIVYGVVIGSVRNDKDLAKMLTEAMAAMAPIIVLSFFAAQFIECFSYSGLGRMLAQAGGQALGQADMPIWLLLVMFILMTAVFNLFIGSMSAKYTMFAPIFVPMLMMVSISPELTQAAYRIGDSVSNIITPLNAYLIIILVFMQKYYPKGGMGTLISMMLPYTIAFTIVWMIMIIVWHTLEIPLGPGGTGPLTYDVMSLTSDG